MVCFGYDINLFILCVTDSGISLETGVLVTAVMPGSPAAKEGTLMPGDRLAAVSLLLCFVLYQTGIIVM